MKKISAIISLSLFVIIFSMSALSFKISNDPDTLGLQEGPTLRELADKAGLMIGTTASSRDEVRRKIVTTQFNTATTTCYPRSINRSPGVHDIEGFNTAVNWIYGLGMKPLHHMLFGPSSYEQEWVTKITSPRSLDSLMWDRINAIISSNDNATKVNSWNIVNEALGNKGAYLTDDRMVWGLMGYEDDKSGLTGEDKVNDKHPVYIRKAFEYCARLAKGKLELRDYNIEAPGIKAKAFYQLVKHLQNSGVKIDAVGFQCHFDLFEGRTLNPEGLASEVHKYQKLGLEVYFCEVDFGRRKVPWTQELAEIQKQEYKKLITVALNEGITQVHFWGFVDGADRGFRTDENPLLYDENLNPKPAYYGVREGLMEYLQKTGKLKK